jgi:hypothetical protein
MTKVDAQDGAPWFLAQALSDLTLSNLTLPNINESRDVCPIAMVDE